MPPLDVSAIVTVQPHRRRRGLTLLCSLGALGAALLGLGAAYLSGGLR
jgi:hypothetical protein